MTRPKHDLPMRMIIGWGFGTLPIALLFNTFNALALRYLTDYIGLAAAVAGSLIALSKIYDAFSDPVMGWISDRTNTPVGRRRPYLLIGSLACGLMIWGLFSLSELPVDGTSVFVVFTVLILYATAYTIYNVPYLAMPAELSMKGHTRSAMMSWRVFIIGGGGLVAGAAGPWLVDWAGGGAQGHSTMGLVIGSAIVVSGIITYFLMSGATEKQQAPAALELNWKQKLKTVFSNKPFALLMGLKLFLLGAVAVSTSTLAFFTVWILEKDYGVLGTIFLVSTLGQIVGTPIWLWIYRRLGAKRTFIASAVIFGGASMTWLLADASEPIAITLLRSGFKGLGSGGILLVGQALLPDVIEYDRLKTSLRREGVLSGIYTTVEKFAFAFGTAFVGVWLQVMNYVERRNPATDTQSDSALLALYFCQSVFPALLIGVACLFVMFYTLDEDKLDAMRAEAAPA